jgi:hypothetical protein
VEGGYWLQVTFTSADGVVKGKKLGRNRSLTSVQNICWAVGLEKSGERVYFCDTTGSIMMKGITGFIALQ